MKLSALVFALALFSLVSFAYPSSEDEAMGLVYGCQASQECYGGAITCTQECSGPTQVCTQQCTDSMMTCIKGCLVGQGVPSPCASILSDLMHDQPYIDCVLRNMPATTPTPAATSTPYHQATATPGGQMECYEQSDCPEGQSCVGGTCQGASSCGSGFVIALFGAVTIGLALRRE